MRDAPQKLSVRSDYVLVLVLLLLCDARRTNIDCRRTHKRAERSVHYCLQWQPYSSEYVCYVICYIYDGVLDEDYHSRRFSKLFFVFLRIGGGELVVLFFFANCACRTHRIL